MQLRFERTLSLIYRRLIRVIVIGKALRITVAALAVRAPQYFAHDGAGDSACGSAQGYWPERARILTGARCFPQRGRFGVVAADRGPYAGAW